MTVQASITPERFYSGLTISDFIAGMTKNRELVEENYHNFDLTPDEIAALHSINTPLRILVLAEDWCGDVVRYLPALACVASTMRGWEVRVLYRDQNLDLADRWLKEGQFRSIPVLAFFDQDWQEVACFVEKPESVYSEEAQARTDFAAQHPDLPDAALPYSEMSQPTLALYTTFIRAFRQQNQLKWQHLFIQEITRRLQSTESREAVGAGCW